MTQTERFPTKSDAVDVALLPVGERGPLRFSVCSILYRQDSYERMLNSFRDAGFDRDVTEFIAGDNRSENNFDGYRLIRDAICRAKGEFVIFCHDDIEIIDRIEILEEKLKELNALDPRWVIAGVAGGIPASGDETDAEDASKRIAKVRKDRKGRVVRSGSFPCRAESVDEFFLIMNRRNFVPGSLDLEGFHFFGTDICLQAELAGGASFIIDYLVHHHGEGTRGFSFRRQKRAIAEKYRKLFPGRKVRTTTTVIDLG